MFEALLGLMLTAGPGSPPAKSDVTAATRRLLATHGPRSMEAADALVAAAGADQLDTVEALLAGGVSADAHGSKGGLTPLILASYAGHERIVKRLLKAKANANERNDDGETALHTSSASPSADRLVPLLLKAGGSHAVADRYGRTPLIVHAQAGRFDAVEALLAAGADPKVIDGDGQGALFDAAMNGHTRVVARLLDAKVPVDQRNTNGATPALAAAGNGHVETLKLLASHGADLKASAGEGIGLLGASAQENHINVVAWLVKQVSPTLVCHPLGTALHVAAYQGHRALIPLLVASGAKVDQEHQTLTPLLLAVSQGQFDVVKALLEAGANPNFGGAKGAPPLSMAALVGDVQVVELLLARGAKLNATNPQGGTALRAAADAGKTEVVRLLLARGAKFDSADAFGKRPIDYAREKGHLEIVKLLED